MANAQEQPPRIRILRRRKQNQCFVETLPQQVALQMMRIPAGTFLMGSPEDEVDRVPWEGPQHKVTVETFFMGRWPVTQPQWQVVAEFPPVERDLNPEPSTFKGGIRPVEKVSCDDAVEFCARLSRESGREYRLPTEAEWEYACRAGTTTPFHFGETITTDLANYRGTDDTSMGWSGSYGEGPKGKYREETTPMDTFGVSNAFGLYDMHGNVWEWCQDYWHENYDGAPINGSAWLEGGDESNRIRRGGSWLDVPRYCRSAYRDYLSPGNASDAIGFRVVCVAPRGL